MQQYPWECNDDLTEDRLLEVASFIAEVRDEVIELHDEALGDTRLSLGMRAYECCRTRLIKKACAEPNGWFSILTSEGRFTFAFGGTPVRFTRNDPKYLPDKKLIVSEQATKQMDMFTEKSFSKTRWFIVFDTHYKSAADAVYFVGYSEYGDIVCQWTIPIEARVPLIGLASDNTPKAVDVLKPKVGIKKQVAHSKVKDE